MKPDWKNKNNLRLLVDEIISNFSLTEDGRVSHAIGVELVLDALFHKVRHDFKLSPDVLFDVFSLAIKNEFSKDVKLKNPNLILSNFQDLCYKKLKTRNKYFLVTTISLNSSSILKRRSINGCNICFYKHLPVKYKKWRDKQIEKHTGDDVQSDGKVMYAVVSTEEPDVLTAVKSALDSLDIVRALIELDIKDGGNFLASDKEHIYPSISTVRLGEYHTLHNQTGKLATSTFWFERNFKKESSLKIRNFHLVDKNLTSRLNNIKACKFEAHIYSSLLSFIEAIDTKETISRFLKLWTSAEKLFNEANNSKELIKRMSFQYTDKAIVTEILSSMRDTRNINVHASVKPLNLELKTTHLRSIIKSNLSLVIRNGSDFNSLDKFTKFLSLPVSLRDIDDQLELLQKRKKRMKDFPLE